MGHCRKGPDVITLSLENCASTLFLNLINTDNGVNRDVAASDPFKDSLEFLFTRIYENRASLTEDKLLYFNKAPEFTLEDLTGVYFKHLTLILKNHTKNRGFCHRVLLPR